MTMVGARDLADLILLAMVAHEKAPKKASGAYRKWDGQTPYGVHPVVCALLLLQETEVPEKLRVSGARALLFHDVPEDTTASIPGSFTSFEKELVADMTFGSSDEEMEKIWLKPVHILLLKLYDKCSNLLDGVWMNSEKRVRYNAYVRRLADAVERNYGKLNIVKIARAITA